MGTENIQGIAGRLQEVREVMRGKSWVNMSLAGSPGGVTDGEELPILGPGCYVT